MEACPLCGSPRWTLVYPSTLETQSLESGDFRCTSEAYGIHPPIDRCDECGLLFIVDDVTDEDIVSCYEQVEDDTYVREQAGRRATFARQLRAIESQHAKGRMVEAGSYTGAFLSQARDAGWDVTGFEPSAWAVERARETYDLELRQSALQHGVLEPGSFGVAVMWDVIEHLTDPRAAASALWNALEPGGLLAISTMDVESIPARVGRARWPWLMSMHRVYFSRATMRRLLEETGFEQVEIRPHVRSISLGYLTERMASTLPAVGRPLRGASSALRADDVVVPFYMGDLFEAYARKPLEG